MFIPCSPHLLEPSFLLDDKERKSLVPEMVLDKVHEVSGRTREMA